jgi:hypothetical protein
MGLWDRIRGWADSNAQRITRCFIADDGGDVRPHADYMRLWLTDMFLAKDRQWFRSHFPAVTASVRLGYAQQGEQEFTRLIQPPPAVRGPGAFSNFALTPLLPYRGGQVEVQGGLSALQGDSSLTAALELLHDLSSLVAPPLAQALGIARKVADGVGTLLDANQGPVLLGTHQGYGSAGGGGETLRSGHLVCIGAPAGTFARAQLEVAGDGLRVDGRPLEGYDSFVLRVERREHRDDWLLPTMDDLLRRAMEALRANDRAAYGAFRRALIADAYLSPDLTRADRKLAAVALAEQLDDAEAGLGLADGPAPTMAEVVQRGPSAAAVERRPDVPLDALLSP